MEDLPLPLQRQMIEMRTVLLSARIGQDHMPVILYESQRNELVA